MPTTAVDTYALTPDQIDFRDTIRQIVRERVAPRAAEIDAKAEYPWDLRKLFAEQDLLGLPFDEEYGGTGTGTLMLNVAIEEIARACASSALILMLQELGTLPIKLFGTEELKQRFLPKCASGEWSPAFALSEPEAGSDPGGMITSAVKRRRRVGRHRHQELDHRTSGSPTSTSSSPRPTRAPAARAASAPSWSRPTAPASASASSSTSSASRARRPASRSSTTSASRPRT